MSGRGVRVVRLALVVAALGLWEAVAWLGDPLLYVGPSRALPALARLVTLQSYPYLPAHLALTVGEIGIAYTLAVGGGIASGFVLGLRPLIGRAYAPLLGAAYAVPSVVWYPSLMLIFGLGGASKVAFGALLGFYPVVVAVLAGIRQVNPQLITVARAFGAGGAAIFARIMLPAMLSTLVGGLRAALALSVVGVLVGEVLGSRAGLGYLINHAYGLLRTADYVALVLLTIVLVAVLDGLASLAERRARRWA